MLSFGIIGGVSEPSIEQNLYGNFELVGGSDIVAGVAATLPTGHTNVFTGAIEGTYIDDGDGLFHYDMNTTQLPLRWQLQRQINGFEEGHTYRYQALVKTTTDAPTGVEVRALNINSLVRLELVDDRNSFCDNTQDFKLMWIDFRCTGINGNAGFRHGCGLWNSTPTRQETKAIRVFDLSLPWDNNLIANGSFLLGAVDWVTENATMTVVDFEGELNVAHVVPTSTWAKIKQAFITEAGKSYTITLRAQGSAINNNTSVFLYNGDLEATSITTVGDIYGVGSGGNVDAWRDFKHTFVATSGFVTVGLNVNNAIGGYFGSVRVEEVL